MKPMLEIFEGERKVAEMPEEEFWEMDGPQKRAFIAIMEMDGRTFGKRGEGDEADSRNERVV